MNNPAVQIKDRHVVSEGDIYATLTQIRYLELRGVALTLENIATFGSGTLTCENSPDLDYTQKCLNAAIAKKKVREEYGLYYLTAKGKARAMPNPGGLSSRYD